MKLTKRRQGFRTHLPPAGDYDEPMPEFLSGGSEVPGESWELLFDEKFEGAGSPDGWTVLNGSVNFTDASAPISGSQSMLVDTGSVRYQGLALRHRQIRLTFKMKLNQASGGYRSISQFLANGGSSSLSSFLNMQNQLEIADERSLNYAHTTTVLTPGGVYDVQYILKGLTPKGLHSLQIGDELISLEFPLFQELTFNSFSLSCDWGKIWWDDMKLEGMP